MIHRTHAPFALVAALAAPVMAQGDDRTVLVNAARIVVAPDTVLTGTAARITIRGGKVTGVGTEIPQSAIDGAERLRYPGATIVPGFVNPHDHLSIGDDLAETIDAYTPELRAIEAFDPFDEDLEHRVSRGVTSIGLAPLSKNTFGGLAAVVKWNGDEGFAIEEASYLKMALVPESLDQDRAPTSRMGATDLIRSQFGYANKPLAIATPDVAVLRDALSGARRVAIHARSLAELICALDLCEELELSPILLGADEAFDCIDRLRASGASIALSPLTFDSERRRLELPAKLAAAGVRFSFMSADAADLRRSAALAVRFGLGRNTALAALTRVPAEQLGVDDRIGSLRVGMDADFDVFTGDPIDLSSRLVAVHVDGKRLAPVEAKKESSR